VFKFLDKKIGKMPIKNHLWWFCIFGIAIWVHRAFGLPWEYLPWFVMLWVTNLPKRANSLILLTGGMLVGYAASISIVYFHDWQSAIFPLTWSTLLLAMLVVYIFGEKSSRRYRRKHQIRVG